MPQPNVMEIEDLNAAADAGGEGSGTFKVTLPEDLVGVILPGGDEAAQAAAPAAPAAPAPKPASARAAQLEREIEAVQRNARDAARNQISVPPAPTARRQHLLETIDKAEDFKTAAALLLDEQDRRNAEWVAAQRTRNRQQTVEDQELAARKRHPDYDRKLEQAGIFAATQVVDGPNGSKVHANPVIAREIYGEPDPAEAAYALATEILDYRATRANPGTEEPVHAAIEAKTEKAPQPTAPAAPAPAAPSAQTQDPRRPEPRGLRNAPSAPPATTTFTREALDKMFETNERAFIRLMDANPDLNEWWLGGRD